MEHYRVNKNKIGDIHIKMFLYAALKKVCNYRPQNYFQEYVHYLPD